VTFGPGVPNPNLLGRCGGEITGVVTIRRNGVVVLEDRGFEEMNCRQRERYISSITLRDNDDLPALAYATYEPAATSWASIPR
jgi:hypothetical protein